MRDCADASVNEIAGHITRHLGADRWLYAPEYGWMQYQGGRWVRHADREAHFLQTEIRTYVAAWLRDDGSRLQPNEIAALAGILTPRGLEKIERLMRRDPMCLTTADSFDSDPYLLNCKNGIVDLRSGEIRPHDPAERLTRITAASYRPGHTHPDWEQACKAFPDEAAARYFQTIAGRGLIGLQNAADTDNPVVLFMLGGGKNGKSLILGAIESAAGDYAGMASEDLLAGKAHTESKMSLRGLRLALVEELADGHRLNVARVKQITDTRKIKGRHLYHAESEWTATHTMIVTSNYKPIVRESDDGTWRRLLAIPFPHRFAPDPKLKRRCSENVEQTDAVLTWLIDGALMDEVPVPESVIAATREWRRAVDLIEVFAEECLEPDPAGVIGRADMLAAYNGYLSANGHQSLNARTFAERFREHKAITALGVAESPNPLVVPDLIATATEGGPVSKRQRAWMGARLTDEGLQAIRRVAR
jgi:P4 family phage/plasmid primase-like protien